MKTSTTRNQTYEANKTRNREGKEFEVLGFAQGTMVKQFLFSDDSSRCSSLDNTSNNVLSTSHIISWRRVCQPVVNHAYAMTVDETNHRWKPIRFEEFRGFKFWNRCLWIFSRRVQSMILAIDRNWYQSIAINRLILEIDDQSMVRDFVTFYRLWSMKWTPSIVIDWNRFWNTLDQAASISYATVCCRGGVEWR